MPSEGLVAVLVQGVDQIGRGAPRAIGERPAKRAPNGYAMLRHVSRLEPIDVKGGTQDGDGPPCTSEGSELPPMSR
jgi:hypothetical protein